MSLPNKVAEGIENSDLPATISAVVMSDSIGYPKRIIEDDGDTHEGEHSSFDQAYDYACTILDTDEVSVDKDETYVWFSK